MTFADRINPQTQTLKKTLAIVALLFAVCLIPSTNLLADTADITIDTNIVADASGEVDEAAILKKGKGVFNSNCASCHAFDRKVTGPALAGSFQRWIDGAEHNGIGGEEWLRRWIINWEDPVAEGNAYAAEMANFDPSDMDKFGTIASGDLDALMVYLKADGVMPGIIADRPPGDDDVVVSDDGNTTLILIILVTVLIILVLVLARVSKVLERILKDKRGESQEARTPIYKNKKIIATLGLVLFVAVAYVLADNAISLGRQQGYAPTQPIEFSHKLHAGQYNIECQYCHHSADEGKHSNIPSTDVCMNCHKVIQEGPEHGKYEISKIYAAIGFDPVDREFIPDYNEMSDEDIHTMFSGWLGSELDSTLDGDAMKAAKKELTSTVDDLVADAGKPIQWKRIHNLPDHVYFNHAQHVNAGEIECETCHGPVDEMDVAYQHAPLSMGWCINCHRQTEIQFKENEYYSEIYLKYHQQLEKGDINQVTVEDIGGTDCQKCHY